MRHPDAEERVRVYVKGAPEYVVNNCNRTFDIGGSKIKLEEDTEYIHQNIIFNEFTSKGLRVIAFAYKDFDVEDFHRLRRENNDF